MHFIIIHHQLEMWQWQYILRCQGCSFMTEIWNWKDLDIDIRIDTKSQLIQLVNGKDYNSKSEYARYWLLDRFFNRFFKKPIK